MPNPRDTMFMNLMNMRQAKLNQKRQDEQIAMQSVGQANAQIAGQRKEQEIATQKERSAMVQQAREAGKYSAVTGAPLPTFMDASMSQAARAGAREWEIERTRKEIENMPRAAEFGLKAAQFEQKKQMELTRIKEEENKLEFEKDLQEVLEKHRRATLKEQRRSRLAVSALKNNKELSPGEISKRQGAVLDQQVDDASKTANALLNGFSASSKQDGTNVAVAAQKAQQLVSAAAAGKISYEDASEQITKLITNALEGKIMDLPSAQPGPSGPIDGMGLVPLVGQSPGGAPQGGGGLTLDMVK